MRFSEITALTLTLLGLTTASTYPQSDTLALNDNLVLSRRELHDIVTKVKREAFVAAYDLATADLHDRGVSPTEYGSATIRAPLRRRNFELVLKMSEISESYVKSGQEAQQAMTKFKMASDKRTRLTIAEKVVSLLTKNISQREAELRIMKQLDRDKEVIAKHEGYIKEQKATKTEWVKKKNEAEKAAGGPVKKQTKG